MLSADAFARVPTLVPEQVHRRTRGDSNNVNIALLSENAWRALTRDGGVHRRRGALQ
jgi:hypothetical protein